jgi:hypothetical protein
MEQIKTENYMDRQKIAGFLHSVLDFGHDLLGKEKFSDGDFQKVKLLKVMGTHVNASVGMCQEERAVQKHMLIQEKLRQSACLLPPIPEGHMPLPGS